MRLAPLVVAEVGLRLAQQPTARLLRLLDLDVVAHIGPSALRMVWFVVAALLVPTALADLASLDRGVEVFFHGTHLGGVVGAVLLLLAMAVALPLLFRGLLRTSSHLPPEYAEEIRRTAAQQGFSPRCVVSMQTGHRIANAALVGLLPWPRYLVITDALMSLLDVHALRGVIAHEVSHARRNHAVLLIVALGVLPTSLLFGWMLMGWVEPESFGFYVSVGVLVLLVVVALRVLAHRFEHEADTDSATAMGAEPCIRALHNLGRLLSIDRDKASWRHPSERARIGLLRKWEVEPAIRDGFARRGWRVRWILLGFGAAVITLLVIGVRRTWPVDRVTLALYSGNIPAAQIAASEVDRDALPLWLQELFDEVRGEAEAAATLVPRGGPWESVRGPLSEKAWEQALVRIDSAEVRAALPYLSLALAGPDPQPLRRTIYYLCAALDAGDEVEVRRLREHLALQPLPDAMHQRLQRLL